MAVASRVPFSLGQRLWNALSAWTVRNSGYQKLGLRRDDLYDDIRFPDVAEALRRIPDDELFLRQYRLKRALDLSMKHAHLPRDQWTTPEQDIRYLKPYIDRVQKEMTEKNAWNRK